MVIMETVINIFSIFVAKRLKLGQCIPLQMAFEGRVLDEYTRQQLKKRTFCENPFTHFPVRENNHDCAGKL